MIQDPAAGTAGFLGAADQYMREQTDDYYNLKPKQLTFQQKKAFIGVELVPGTRRLAPADIRTLKSQVGHWQHIRKHSDGKQ
ncbi:MAG: hypothetical protein AB8B97_23185 [Granulosicoccus sp.]